MLVSRVEWVLFRSLRIISEVDSRLNEFSGRVSLLFESER